MSYYPIFIDLEGKKVVVVGGGKVALRKINTFLEHGADVHIISKELEPDLRKYVDERKVSYNEREFKEEDLENAFIVIVATNDKDFNHEISKIVREKGILVNAVDQPADCSFIVPSILTRGDLIIAISTSGRSPAFAKKVRKELSEKYGDVYEDFLVMMGKIRKEILSWGLPQKENGRIFQSLIESPAIEALNNKDYNEIATILGRILEKDVSYRDVMEYLKKD